MSCNTVYGPADVLENDKHPSYCVGDAKTARIFRTELLPLLLSLLASVKRKKLSNILQSGKKKKDLKCSQLHFVAINTPN